MLEVQRFLRSGGTVDGLLKTYAIKSRRHPVFPNLVLLKYDQIASDFSSQIVRECRGLILDESEDWRVVCRSFDKFFNHGEGHAAPIDWSTARVQEKLDGSLCNLYHYAGDWHVATSGSPDAGGQVHDEDGLTFAEYFWQTFSSVAYNLPRPGFNEMVLSFELMGPKNRIVVEHQKASLRLIGVRNRDTGTQYYVNGLEPLTGVAPVREFNLTSFADMEATFPSLSPLTQEGYVVVDGNWNRVKVKSPGYVALHHAKDGMTERAFMDIARRGETSEVEAAFPEIAARIEATRAGFMGVRERIANDFEAIKDAGDQKSFAMLAVPHPWAGVLFQMRKGTPIGDALLAVDVDKLISWTRKVAS